MEWIVEKLLSGDTSLPIKNLRIFQEQANSFLQKKLSLTHEEYMRPKSSYIKIIKQYFEFYNIVNYCIEKGNFVNVYAFSIPNLHFENQPEKSFIMKRMISYTLQNIPFIITFDVDRFYYLVHPIFTQETDRIILPRKSRLHLTEKEVQEEMELLFEKVISYVGDMQENFP